MSIVFGSLTGMLVGMVLILPVLIYPLIAHRLPAMRRYGRGQNSRPWQRYAVVLDNRPFGYKVDSIHTFKLTARLYVRASQHYKVEKLSFIKSETARLKNPDDFWSTLRVVRNLDHTAPGWRQTSQSA